jgi:hypothetical protein
VKYLFATIGGLVALANLVFSTTDARVFAIASILAIPLASRLPQLPLNTRTARNRYFIANGITCLGAVLLLSQGALGQQRLASEWFGFGIGMWAINSLAIWAIVRVALPDWVKETKQGEPNG